MKALIALVVCLAIFAAVVVMFARVLTLMSCTGGDMTEEMEQDFAEGGVSQTEPVVCSAPAETEAGKAHA